MNPTLSAPESWINEIHPKDRIELAHKQRDLDLNELGWAIRMIDFHLPMMGIRQSGEGINYYRDFDPDSDDEWQVPVATRTRLVQTLNLALDHVAAHFQRAAEYRQTEVGSEQIAQVDFDTIAPFEPKQPTVNLESDLTVEQACGQLLEKLQGKAWFHGLFPTIGSILIILTRMIDRSEQAEIPAFFAGYRVDFKVFDPNTMRMEPSE